VGSRSILVSWYFDILLESPSESTSSSLAAVTNAAPSEHDKPKHLTVFPIAAFLAYVTECRAFEKRLLQLKCYADDNYILGTSM
jgi:hypothetical protein